MSSDGSHSEASAAKWAVEISYFAVHVVPHCNLICRACAHASPIQKPAFVKPASVKRDLLKLAPMLHAQRLCFTGGEPLLHPQIVDILRIARAAGIGDSIEVLTNGTLLNRMDADFWSHVDRVNVSLYPGVSVRIDHPEKTNVVRFDEFRETMSASRNEDLHSLRRIWDTCGETGRSSGIMDGRLVPCMQAAYIARLARRKTGVTIKDLTEERLVRFYEDGQHMRECLYCTGARGRVFPHQRTTLKAFRENYERPIMDMLGNDDSSRWTPSLDAGLDLPASGTVATQRTCRKKTPSEPER